MSAYERRNLCTLEYKPLDKWFKITSWYDSFLCYKFVMSESQIELDLSVRQLSSPVISYVIAFMKVFTVKPLIVCDSVMNSDAYFNDKLHLPHDCMLWNLWKQLSTIIRNVDSVEFRTWGTTLWGLERIWNFIDNMFEWHLTFILMGQSNICLS